jgi:hypothetical protein
MNRTDPKHILHTGEKSKRFMFETNLSGCCIVAVEYLPGVGYEVWSSTDHQNYDVCDGRFTDTNEGFRLTMLRYAECLASVSWVDSFGIAE